METNIEQLKITYKTRETKNNNTKQKQKLTIKQ